MFKSSKLRAYREIIKNDIEYTVFAKHTNWLGSTDCEAVNKELKLLDKLEEKITGIPRRPRCQWVS